MSMIDLGRKGPEPVTAEAPAEKSSKPRVVYPSLYLSGDAEDFKSLPDSGTMQVKYSVRRRSVSAEDDKKTSSLELEIEKILSTNPAKEKSSAEALDELAESVEPGDEDEDDEK